MEKLPIVGKRKLEPSSSASPFPEFFPINHGTGQPLSGGIISLMYNEYPDPTFMPSEEQMRSSGYDYAASLREQVALNPGLASLTQNLSNLMTPVNMSTALTTGLAANVVAGAMPQSILANGMPSASSFQTRESVTGVQDQNLMSEHEVRESEGNGSNASRENLGDRGSNSPSQSISRFNVGMRSGVTNELSTNGTESNAPVSADGVNSVTGTSPTENWDRISEDMSPEDLEQLRLKRNNMNPLDKLTTNQYLLCLRQIESKLKGIRARIIQRDLQHLDTQLQQLRFQIDHYTEEFNFLKSNHYLRAGDFNNLLSLEEFITTTLSPQLTLYQLDYQQITDSSTTQNEVPVILSIVNQENAGPIFKEKAIGPFTLRLLTGATITQIQSGPVQPELVDTSQRVKRNNQELENVKQNFQENGTATFSDLKFSSGTFPNLVRLKFRVTIQIIVNGQRITKTIESLPTKPFISMTNTGSQWKDAAGTWLKEDLFKDSYEVSIAQLWNYFQKHYLVATKQEISTIKRPLFMKDFEYLLNAKFPPAGSKKQTINQKEFNWFWDWIGPGLKKIRYQKYLLWLFENGYLAAFVTSKESEEHLKNENPGTFLIRFSERIDGELVISYVHGSGVRHYLIQADDTADKKKTLIDFLGQNKIFMYILQINTQPTGKRVFYKHSKDKVLTKYYKKQPKPASTSQPLDNNPYDGRLPFDLNAL